MTLCRSWVCFWYSLDLDETRKEAAKTFEKASEGMLCGGATPRGMVRSQPIRDCVSDERVYFSWRPAVQNRPEIWPPAEDFFDEKEGPGRILVKGRWVSDRRLRMAVSGGGCLERIC